MAIGLLVTAAPARAGLIHEITVTDDSGLGLVGGGRIRFAEAVGSCAGAACLTLLDGIEVSFDDSSFRTGDIWGSPSEVVEATWSIDLRTWALSGFIQLSEKSRISPFLSFTEGFAENLNTDVRSSLETQAVPAPASLPLFALGLLALGWLIPNLGDNDPSHRDPRLAR